MNHARWETHSAPIGAEELIGARRMTGTRSRHRPLAGAIAITGLFTVLWNLKGCAPNDRASYELRLEDTGKPALHALREERLREIMSDLNRLTFESMPQEMNNHVQRNRDFVRLAEVADRLAQDAQAIPLVLQEVRMASEDRHVFNSYASKLQEEATGLAELARSRSMEALRTKMDEMITTCNACHSAFRILPRAR
ncbi:hypothetical protein B7486_16875 [cyanobacterium TDX16]|nr:hypothetical protein B7486_16875 [cyanobacterium TDX16]